MYVYWVFENIRTELYTLADNCIFNEDLSTITKVIRVLTKNVILNKLRVVQLINKYTALYSIPMSIAEFTTRHQWTLF
jgi:hypothetical protein